MKMLVLVFALISINAFADIDSALNNYKAKNYSAALPELTDLAKQGNPLAQYRLGAMYLHGIGVTQDYSQALTWLELAANQGNASAENDLGVMYEKGLGVPLNDLMSVKWFALSAKQNNIEAQTNLGFHYQTGRGVSQSYQEALKWYRLAADQGQYNALNNLGNMYENGGAVDKNLIVAYALYSLSKLKNESPENKAIQNRQRLSDKISTNDIHQSNVLASALSRPGKFLSTLDAYIASPNIWLSTTISLVPNISISDLVIDFQPNPTDYYPASSKKNGEKGDAIVRLVVDRAGKVESANVLHSSGFPPLDDAAEQIAKAYLFQPYLVNGNAIRFQMNLLFRFNPKPRPPQTQTDNEK